MLNQENYDGTYDPSAGEVCLDFVNTVSWRKTATPHEWIADFSNLVEWGQIVGEIDTGDARRLLEHAKDDPQQAQAMLNRARSLREALYRIFEATISGKSPDAEDMEIMNAELQAAGKHLEISLQANQFHWSWNTRQDNPDRILWPVARSAAELLTSERLQRIGMCQGEGCGWLFLDVSKNHSRRWCEMGSCGNREKARKHYRRTHAAPVPRKGRKVSQPGFSERIE